MAGSSKHGDRQPWAASLSQAVAGAGTTSQSRHPACLPAPEEIPALLPPPGSVVWRYAGDVRLLPVGAYAIVLQVADLTVGAGVSEHSEFRADPWGRLLRTLDYSYTMTYGGPDAAAAMGARIREMHRRIKGLRPDGERYHALEPGAYAWVHATLAHAIVAGHSLLGRPMPSSLVERFYDEWRRLGRLVGVRERDLPEGWGEFGDYFRQTCAERLQRTAAVDEVLDALADPVGPALPLLRGPAWRVLRVPAVHQIGLITGGLLGPDLRMRLGVPWSPARDRELRLVGAVSRALTPVLPSMARNVGPSYLRWRREAIAAEA
jgi:uncharacterized protein (DUF2236 family)